MSRSQIQQRILSAITILCVFSQTGIGSSQEPHGSEPWEITVEDPSSNLEVRFVGRKLGSFCYPLRIMVKKSGDKDEHEFQMTEPASVVLHSGKLESIWAPNGSFLVLPRGRFTGYTVFGVEKLPESVVKGYGTHSVQILGEDYDSWWHEDGQWKDERTFSFRVGLEQDLYDCNWDVISGTVECPDLNPNQYSTGPEPGEEILGNEVADLELALTGRRLHGTFFVDDITIQNSDGSEAYEFITKDQVSLKYYSHASLKNAWSPDGSLLILPQGRFDGFTVFSTETLPLEITKGRGFRSIAIRGSNGHAWYHEDPVWIDEITVRFGAGLSGDVFMFRWNTETGELVSEDLKEGQFAVQREP